MEENKNVNRKDRSSLVTMLIMIVLCCGMFVALVFGGVVPVKTAIGYTDVDTAAKVKRSKQVADEETLRELLLLDTTLDIYVTEDMEIDETFIVKGKKTLCGDVVISADMAGKFTQMYIFDVQIGATLNYDGITIDGHGTADGIRVNEKAQLNILSGTIQYMRNGVYTNGTVIMEDGLVQHCSQQAFFASYKSKVSLNGGLCYNSGENALRLDKMSYAEINDGMTIQKSRGYAVYNLGELNVYGGKILDTQSAAFATENGIHMEYKGEDPNGKIILDNIGTLGVRVAGKGDVYVSDIQGTNIGTNAVWNAGDSVGKLTIEDCYFENVGVANSNGLSLCGNTTVKNVTIKKANNGGINFRENSEFNVSGLTIEDAVGNAITVRGKLNAENMTIKGSNIAIWINSVLNGKNINLSDSTMHNIQTWEGAEINIDGGVLAQTKRTNISMNSGSKVTLKDVAVQGVKDEELYCIHVSKDTELTIKGDTTITGATRVGVCLYENAKFTMEGGKIFGIKGTATGAAVWLREKGAVFTMKGGSITGNSTPVTSGAVFVADKTTFNMYGGTISNNKTEASGGAVQVQGVMNMYGGTITDNYAKTSGGGVNVGNNTSAKIFGTFNMYGGTISNNKADNNGGGINVSGSTTCNISGGTIKNNKAEGIGNGIHDNGKLTVSGKAYIPGNEIQLNNKGVVLKITGNSLSKHSKKDPLRVIPNGITFIGDIVVECDSDSAAKNLVNKHVASGTSAYTLVQKEKNMTVGINAADMNVKGAETVFVSNFQELKEAVETTKTKRIIVLGADIEWETVIQAPLGTTVMIRDDGTTRTLSRTKDNNSRYFETCYGSGFILQATAPGKLVIDGSTEKELSGSVVNLFMRGDTNVSGVTFKDNGFATGSGGGFFNQIYGTANISNSTFENGLATNGAAINQTGGTLNVKGCTFTNNKAANYGGAISSTGGEVVVEESTFTGNHAPNYGGVLYASGKTAKVVNSTMVDNTAYRGGAIYGGNNCDVTVFSDANHEFKGNSVAAKNETETDARGGAINIGSGTLKIKGYQFVDNTSDYTGGAIHLNGNDSIVVSIENAKFYDNHADDKGGAILNYSTNKTKGLTIKDSVFDNNTTGANGGAIWSVQDGTSDVATLTVKNSTFVENNAKQLGGALFVQGIIMDAEALIFTDNKAELNGGAVYVNGATANIADSEFAGNEATGNGGAIYNGSTGTINLTGTGSFSDNIANNALAEANYGGGAICVGTGTLNVDGYTFKGNVSKNNVAGAIRLNNTGIVATIKNSTFDSNSTTGIKGNVDGGGAILATAKELNVEGCTFTNNTTDARGGAIFAYFADVNIVSSTFGGDDAGNTAYRGGAIYGASTDIICNISEAYTTAALFKGNEVSAKGSDTDPRGGAICIGAGTLQVDDYEFTANHSGVTGGAIHLNGDNIVAKMNKCVFDGNTSTWQGGALYNNSTNTADGVTITDSVFKNNSAGAAGGAINNNNPSPLKITGTTFESNSSPKSTSGAIKMSNGTLTAENCDFIKNTASGNGGAIEAVGSSKVILKVTDGKKHVFSENASSGKGGVIRVNADGASLEIDGYTFEKNTASQSGGVIHTVKNPNTSNVTLIIKNTSFVENEISGVSYGGAIFVQGQTLDADNVTFIRNKSKDDLGGAIYVNGGTANINNGVFTENEASSGGAIYNGASGIVNLTGTGNFTKNHAKSSSATGGGAICVGTGTLTVDGYAFTKNVSESQYGGAIRLNNTGIVTTIKNSTFDENRTNGSGVGGGAISANCKTFTVEGCTFTKNATNGQGGALLIFNAQATITSTTFGGENAGNSAYQGGAIYSGSSAKVVLNKSNAYSTEAIFEGNTVSATDSSTDARGGAICVGSGSLSVDGYKFVANSSSNVGGAINVNGGNIVATINNCEFEENTSTNQGGAIYNNSTNTGDGITVSNTVFKKNSAKAPGGAIRHGNPALLKLTSVTFEGNKSEQNGGAISVESAKANITNSVFKVNESNGNGGAIFADNSNVNISNGSFAENKAKGNGGAIFNAGTGTLTLTGTGSFTNNISQCQLSDNPGGGAICINEGTLSVDGYAFNGNVCESQYGGAIRLNNVNIVATIKNSTFDSNKTNGSGQGGGAITANCKTFTVEGCTFTKNTTNGQGGAMLIYNAQATITSTTFGGENAGNSAYQGGAIYSGSSAKVVLNKSTSYSTEALFKGNTAIAKGSSTDARGGAICVGSGSLSVDGYKFVANSSSNVGGAINVNGGNIVATINNCEFEENTSTNQGGAIYNNSTNTGDGITVSNTVFKKNSAKAPGGAIRHGNPALLKLTSVTFEGNKSEQNGGAIFVEGAKANIANGVFKANVAKGSGGAIFNAGTGTLTLTGTGSFTNNISQCQLSDNPGGGAICINEGTLSVDGYAFNGNVCESQYGGAIRLNNVNIVATIKNSTFDSNKTNGSGQGGGAITANCKTFTVEGCTFTKNTTNGQGGAILVFNAQMTVTSSKFGGENAGNSAKQGGAIYGSNTKVVLNKSNAYSKETIFQGNMAKGGDPRGGAICLGSGSMSVDGYKFVGNSSTGTGGAIHVNGSNIVVTINGCEFNGNSATAQGGAIYNNSTNTADGMTITDSVFNNNTSGAAGGAINNNSTAPLKTTRTDFNSNKSDSTAACIKMNGGTLTVTDCNFRENHSKGKGGVMEATGSTPTIVFQVSAGKEGQYGFYGNHSDATGGVFRTNWINTMSVTGYVFEDNYCSGGTNGQIIDAGEGTGAGKITLNSCTNLSSSDILVTVTGSVVQQNMLKDE